MKLITVGLLIMPMIFQVIDGGCGCEAWCQKRGQQYGICGDGDTCICSSGPIADPTNGCGCKAWCEERGYPGGVCGDGHTCLCTPKTDKKSNEYTRGQYKLTITNKDHKDVDNQTQQRIIDIYFHVYPRIRSRFNKEARKDVQITIDPGYKGVAYASNGQIVISASYLANHPKNTDLVTHELMHIVQSYPNGQPGWLVEGIADYVRWKYGRDNAGGNWELPSFAPSQHYTKSYAVTGRFLAWLERRVQADIIDRLDRALRKNKYSNGKVWNELTGKSVDQLWKDYSKRPDL